MISPISDVPQTPVGHWGWFELPTPALLAGLFQSPSSLSAQQPLAGEGMLEWIPYCKYLHYPPQLQCRAVLCSAVQYSAVQCSVR